MLHSVEARPGEGGTTGAQGYFRNKGHVKSSGHPTKDLIRAYGVYLPQIIMRTDELLTSPQSHHCSHTEQSAYDQVKSAAGPAHLIVWFLGTIRFRI